MRYFFRFRTADFLFRAEVSSLATNQYQILTMTNGMTIRAGVGSMGISW